MSIVSVWIIRLVGVCLSFILIYYSLSYRLGGYVPKDFYDNGWNTSPLPWQTAPPETWLALAEKFHQEENYIDAERYTFKALNASNFDGQAFSQLARIYEKTKDSENTKKTLELASKYAPAKIKVRIEISSYWVKKNRWDKAIEEWNNILTRTHDSNIRSAFYPLLQQLISDKDGFNFFIPLLKNPPIWWESFYHYLHKNKIDIQLIKSIHQARSESKSPLTKHERRLFVSRLQQEKQWGDAYFSWLSGLDAKHIKLSQLIFDGGFEGESFNTGFDWNFSKNIKNLKIRTANTSGVTGRKALQINFNNKQINFNHISQTLILPPGSYSLHYRYRINRLKNSEGLTWRIRCKNSNAKQLILAESKALKERSPWSKESLHFIIPKNCITQSIRLEATSKFFHNQKFHGTLWFDDIQITKNTDQNKDNK